MTIGTTRLPTIRHITMPSSIAAESFARRAFTRSCNTTCDNVHTFRAHHATAAPHLHESERAGDPLISALSVPPCPSPLHC